VCPKLKEKTRFVRMSQSFLGQTWEGGTGKAHGGPRFGRMMAGKKLTASNRKVGASHENQGGETLVWKGRRGLEGSWKKPPE